ncbi:MAG: DUF5694 domain-containing protein [Pacificimonas sp.]
MLRSLTIAILAFVFSGTAAAQPTPGPEPVDVLLLGSWHFSNPGQDVVNVESEDVLSERRVPELERLAASLATFQPTKVAIERQPKGGEFRDPGFANVAEALKSDRGEDVQIGYRVARLMNHDAVYRIDERPEGDEPDYFPYGKVQAFLDARDRGDELAEDWAAIRQSAELFERLQPNQSIAELLFFMNSGLTPQTLDYSVISVGEGEEQPGAELAAYWFMRNAKMFNKLMQVDEPGDRVLLIVGNGHAPWLRFLVENTPGYRLVDPAPYLRAAF